MYITKDIIYVYDGSFDGFLCCVYESVYGKEIPAEILTDEELNISFFAPRTILTDEERASRVYASLDIKICLEARELIETVFLSNLSNKEIRLLRFILFAYKNGAKALQMLSHPIVSPILMAEKALRNEAHLLLGFLRFQDVGGALVATISPQNYVLPFIRHHFCTRFANEDFLIFDDVHHAALIYENGVAKIAAIDSITAPTPSIIEKRYRNLWKQFYHTISITSRENKRCRMTHCPKHFWGNMTEMPDIAKNK